MRKLKLFRKPLKEAWHEELKKPQKKGEAVPVWLFTIGYIFLVVCLILGIPFPSAPNPEPIPPEDLPVFITIMIVLYFVILGLMKLIDYLRKRRQQNSL
jgi:drug/metabolite transporter (DMT)-like permease